MRTEEIITHNNLSKMKTKILPTFLQGNYKATSGAFNNTPHGMFANV